MPDSPFSFLSSLLPSSGNPQSQSDMARYTGPTAGSGDFIGPAGLDYLTGKPSKGQVERAQANEAQEAMAALFQQAAALRDQTPDAQPNMLLKQLVMSPGGQRELMRLPAGEHTKALQQISALLANEPNKTTLMNEGQTALIQDPRGNIRGTYQAPEKSQIVGQDQTLVRNGQPIFQGERKPMAVPFDSSLVRPGAPGQSSELLLPGNDKELHKSAVKQLEGIAEQGQQAQHDDLALSQLETLGDRIGTGGAAVVRAHLARLGIKLKGASDIEAFNALVDKLAPQQRIPGTGATSDKDLAGFKASLPALINSPGGNSLILQTLKALNADKRARGDIADQVFQGDLGIKDALKQMRSLPDPLERFRAAASKGAPQRPTPKIRTYNPATGQLE